MFVCGPHITGDPTDESGKLNDDIIKSGRYLPVPSSTVSVGSFPCYVRVKGA